jgi:hypothetical protein
MRAARGLVRVVSLLAIALAVSVAGLAGQRAAEASSAASNGSPGADGAGAPAGSDAGGAKRKSHKPNSKKSGPKSKASPDTKITRGKSTHLARQKPARAQASTINENVTLTPFPSHAGAAKKALAQNRRDQLNDAERVARGPAQAERWQTVLFHLRDLDARADSEGCFWRLVSYYRLGQIERARSLRQACELGSKDAAVIEAEDEQAERLQPAGTLADTGSAPVGNLGPYTGDPPAKVDR